MSRELVIAPLGLITQPNKMGQYPAGGLSVAQDVFMRAPGVVEVSPLASTLASTFGTTELLIPSDAEMLRLGSSSGLNYWEWFSASTDNFGTIPFTFYGNGLANWTRSRKRFLVTTANGPIVFDFAAPAFPAERVPRLCGIYAPSMRASRQNPGTGNALKANTHCSIICLVKRVFADGYELISAMSLPVDSGITFSISDTDLSYQISFVSWSESTGLIQVGDIVEIYRTRSQPSGTAGIGGTSCDATYYLTTTHVIDVGETQFVTVLDATPDTGLGRAAYTNPGQGGGEATYISPPAAPIACTFKGYTFLFNITEAAQLELQTLGGIGYAALADPAAWRANLVGGRELTATWTNGSATLTGISAAHMVGIQVGQVIRDNAVFGMSNDLIISAIGASTITIAGFPAVIAGGTKTFVAWDTMTIDGATGGYGGNGSVPTLDGLMFEAYSGSVLGTAWSHNVQDDTAQAASLAYFSSTFLCSPTPNIFSISKRRAAPLSSPATLSLNATNGQNYQPALPLFGASPKVITPTASLNGFAWSEEQDPDAWPPANRGRIGSGKLLAAVPTRDAIWIFATDGLWRLSGDGGAVGAEGFDWRVDLVDSTLVISGPQACGVLRDTVYSYTARGVAAISDADGVNDRLSEGVIGDQLPGTAYVDTNTIKVRADQDKDEVWVVVGSAARVWNYNSKAWVRSVQLSTSSTNAYEYWPVVNSLVMVDDGTVRARYFDAAQTSYANGFVSYQPLYLDDPASSKRWIDVTWVFDPAIALPGVAVNYNTGAYGFIVQPKLNSTDARVTFLVPRNAPAVAPSIALGLAFDLAVGVSKPPKLWGLSARARVVGEKRVRRIP